jgi:hypothetical protein
MPGVEALTDEENTQIDLERTDWLLEPSGDRVLKRDFIYADVVLRVSWITRGELLNRKKRDSVWLKDKTGSGFGHSEDYAALFLYDNGTACYSLTGTAMPVMQSQPGGLAECPIWNRWLNPKASKALFDQFLNTLPTSKFTKEPLTEDSACVILEYAQDGKVREKHFYLPGLPYIYRTVIDVKGEDCTDWNSHDERLQVQEWVAKEHRLISDKPDE